MSGVNQDQRRRIKARRFSPSLSLEFYLIDFVKNESVGLSHYSYRIIIAMV